MIFTAVKLNAYRVLTPKWAYQPCSGAGAATAGGRFNRIEQSAVYLALEPETALAEYSQSEPLFGPGTIACFQIELARVADFSAGYDPDWDALWMDWDCAWKRLAFIDDIEPPTWVMADEVVAGEASGLLFPSTKRPGGTNLVIYPDQLREGDSLQVHDPDGALPRSQDSWIPAE
ncbi:RES family NAD+ phosphorylase [Stenotrophomonas oahuensis]|uniref:RES family NAD+ phosphorylase n=1 Tax=Stenotrophomonas oahuensis TaxID=3003271 RepID=A0ABY9YT04_9GAMM|nr:RES family NAD+ phosphorylase [Stenotrophomonas sp. A5586]WNH53853.1 RES family NAD+ phosphorylase [Stenotrophomonas sp. A5586]